MAWKNNTPLKPRNGQTLIVGIVARISGCQNQKEVSLEDQVAHGKDVGAELYNGPTDHRIIATKGKGERLDRPELLDLEKLLRAKELDLLVCEDIGRMIRGAYAVRLFGIAVDHGVRVLSPNDDIDTADPNWEEDVMAACRDHVSQSARRRGRRCRRRRSGRWRAGGAGDPAAGAGRGRAGPRPSGLRSARRCRRRARRSRAAVGRRGAPSGRTRGCVEAWLAPRAKGTGRGRGRLWLTSNFPSGDTRGCHQ
jgi:hypothetical protein